MCGIVGGYSDRVAQGVAALRHRGPDCQDMVAIGGATLGHTRLSIIDIGSRSDQPFRYGDITLVFNGEIWNYKSLKTDLEKLGDRFTTLGDTEVLAAAINRWGTDALQKLDGMFACAWVYDGSQIFLARDKYGEIPLHIAKQKPFLFASEIKALLAMEAYPMSVTDIPPGSYAIASKKGIQLHQYYDIPMVKRDASLSQSSRELIPLVSSGVAERSISDVPVCTLLSGGIDSACVAYHLKKQIPGIVAYTAVFNPKSRDLRCAREVARALGMDLIEVKIPMPTADDLSSVIGAIEMDYKAQVEIGWACLKLAERMQSDGFRVTFSGEGSDELWASYGFAYHALKTQDWHQYRKNLFLSQSRKNFVRCNKIFMAHSIECRLPFLHFPLVEYAISLPRSAVQDGKSKPKAIIQNAYKGILPDSVASRPKVAFQDGLGLKEAISRSLVNPKAFYSSEFRKIYGHS